MEFDYRRAEAEDQDPGAEDVRDSMVDVIDASGSVSIQDMITLAGKSTTNFYVGREMEYDKTMQKNEGVLQHLLIDV